MEEVFEPNVEKDYSGYYVKFENSDDDTEYYLVEPFNKRANGVNGKMISDSMAESSETAEDSLFLVHHSNSSKYEPP